MYSSRKYLQDVVCLTQLRDQTHANWSKILAVCAHSIGILSGFQFLHPYCSSLQTSQPSLATLWPNGVRNIGPSDQQWIREYLVQMEWTWNRPRFPSTNAPTLRSKPVCGIDHPQLRDSTVGRSHSQYDRVWEKGFEKLPRPGSWTEKVMGHSVVASRGFALVPLGHCSRRIQYWLLVPPELCGISSLLILHGDYVGWVGEGVPDKITGETSL